MIFVRRRYKGSIGYAVMDFPRFVLFSRGIDIDWNEQTFFNHLWQFILQN